MYTTIAVLFWYIKFILKGWGKAVEIAYREFQKFWILQVPVSNIPTPKIIPTLS